MVKLNVQSLRGSYGPSAAGSGLNTCRSVVLFALVNVLSFYQSLLVYVFIIISVVVSIYVLLCLKQLV